MFTRLRGRLNYANVVATLALFIALGGSSYAVSQISGSQIRNASIAGKKLKRNTLGGKRIKESRLGTVPSARNARRIGGLTRPGSCCSDALRARSPPPTSASRPSRDRRRHYSSAVRHVRGNRRPAAAADGDCPPTASCGGRSTSTRWARSRPAAS